MGSHSEAPRFSTFKCLDPYGAERIEVLRGPSSVLYGQGEPSGIINYVSKRPLETTKREIELLGGSFNQRSAHRDPQRALPMARRDGWRFTQQP
jgi:iron complex outermembrane receptor protein